MGKEDWCKAPTRDEYTSFDFFLCIMLNIGIALIQ
jgi:hypothetical protein